MNTSIAHPTFRRPPTGTCRAFTLLELLLSIFIFFLLSALALPTIERSRARAKRVACVGQLRQLGIAYHGFAHDHGDKFPYQTPVKEGGTLEFMRAASAVRGDFYFAFRHSQALSNDLVAPKLLICPTDTRLPAPTFEALRNENISYFVGASAEYRVPFSLLAGDGNISDGYEGASSLLRLATNTPVAWTRGCHEFQGNILFADGHVEGVGRGALAGVVYNSGQPVTTILPPVIPPPGMEPAGGGGNTTVVYGGPVNVFQDFFQAAPGGSSVGANGNPNLTPTMRPPTPPADRPTPAAPMNATTAVNPAGRRRAATGAASNAAALAATSLNPAGIATNVSALATDPTPERTARAAEGPADSPNVFTLITHPERCWSCWIVLMLLALVCTGLLGREVLRQRRSRYRGIAPMPPLHARPSGGGT